MSTCKQIPCYILPSQGLDLCSIQDVLLKSVDDWRHALDRDEVVAAVFIDLTKAFDTTDHGLLLREVGNVWRPR